MNEEQKVVPFTIEDCYHVCRLLYPDRSEKKKFKACPEAAPEMAKETSS